MVGVSGRIGRCRTCSKRRVKCDEAKPFCNRCIKGGFECLGYDQPYQWRHYAGPFPEQLTKETHATAITFVNGPRARKPAKNLNELSLAAFKGDFCFARMLDNVVWSSFGVGWFEKAVTGKMGDVSSKASKALARSSFGRLEHMQDLEFQGAEDYGDCLRSMAVTLKGKDPVDARNLIAPILLLLTTSLNYPYRPYESFMAQQGASPQGGQSTSASYISNDLAAVRSHLRGLGSIIYSCGPQAFRQEPWTSMFDCTRTNLIMAGLYHRKRLFLEGTDWLTVPWSQNPSTKTEQSKLLDILVFIPSLLEYFDTLIQTERETPDSDTATQTPPVETLRTALKDEIASKLLTLYQWRWSWQQRHSRAVKTVLSKNKLYKNAPDFLSGRLHFDSAVRAADIGLYDSLLMWLIVLLWNIGLSNREIWAVVSDCGQKAYLNILETCETGAPVDDPAFFEPLIRPASTIGLRDLATEICRVYEWQSVNHPLATKSSEAIYLYMFPLGMAMKVLQPEDPLQEWITEMVKTDPITVAYASGRHTSLGFSNFVTPEMISGIEQ